MESSIRGFFFLLKKLKKAGLSAGNHQYTNCVYSWEEELIGLWVPFLLSEKSLDFTR